MASEKIVLSLIVPTYGVENYIYDFLDSLEANLVPGVEVIIVDDGTKDRSGVIADEFASRHAGCVRVLHKENGGLSSARNAGLELAAGEYVIFPDPDDWLEKDYCQSILETIEKYNHPDMVFFDYYRCKSSKEKLLTIPAFGKTGMVPKESFLREFAKDQPFKSMVWCKAIKRKFYLGRGFDLDIKVCEDALLLTDMVLEMNTFAYLKKPLYFYRIREGSLLRALDVENSKKCIPIAFDRYEKFSKVLGEVSLSMTVKFCWLYLKRVYALNSSADTEFEENYLKDNLKTVLFDKDIEINLKRHCIFVQLGIARKYIQWKYRK